MDKKKIIITITVVALIILIGVLVFMKVKNSNIENNDGLSVIEQITLNDSEKEILAMLKELDHSLQNPNERKITYESNEDNNSMNFMPTESMELKDFISEIYEARKSITEDGNIIYLLDVNLKTTENMDFFNLTVSRNFLKRLAFLGNLVYNDFILNLLLLFLIAVPTFDF